MESVQNQNYKIAQTTPVMRSVQNQSAKNCPTITSDEKCPKSKTKNVHPPWVMKSVQNQSVENIPPTINDKKCPISQYTKDCAATISDEMCLIQSRRLPTSHQGWGVSKIKLKDCPLNITDEKCPTPKTIQMFTCHPWGKVSKVKLQDCQTPTSDGT